MGVDRTDYALVGVRFNYDEFVEKNGGDDAYEKFDSIHDNGYREKFSKDIACIWDGMNGEYIFFGIILAKAVEKNGGGA